MSNGFGIFSMVIILTLSAPLWADDSCDSSALAANFSQYKLQKISELTKEVNDDENVISDFKQYYKKLNKLRACQKKNKEDLTSCEKQTIFIRKTINQYITLQRNFWTVEKNGLCTNYPNEVSWLLRNTRGEQFLTYLNGFVLLNKDLKCQAKDGIVTGRNILISDSTRSISKFFVVDFGVPLDAYKVHQFWAWSYPIGKNESFTRTIEGSDVRYTWSNGADLLVDSDTGLISDSNFLAPSSYMTGCVSDHDEGVGTKRHYWPVIDILTSGQQYISGDPVIVKP